MENAWGVRLLAFFWDMTHENSCNYSFIKLEDGQVDFKKAL